ncbi:MAG: F0F1 ATP synthase subunit epsilon [Kiritimatiellae bacterium]|jgi:F-type H+-transporting ATPase subunit epsilon|nr:F0F1 ATP synthase subunit epsilon [Kiritimatiellia bacterium]
MSSFPLRILTPEGPVVDAEVETIVVTAFNGSLGVLAGHAPMIAAVVIGPGKVVQNGITTWYVFGEGTLEVRGPDVILLVDFAEKAANYEAAKEQTAQAQA